MVLGDFVLESNQYGRMEVTVKPKKDISLEEQLKEVIPLIQGQITVREFDELDLNETEDSILADPSVKNFGLQSWRTGVLSGKFQNEPYGLTCCDNRTCLRHDRDSGYYQKVD